MQNVFLVAIRPVFKDIYHMQCSSAMKARLLNTSGECSVVCFNFAWTTNTEVNIYIVD